jgi:hypothetical protein
MFAAKDEVPPLAAAYFRSEEDLEQGRNGVVEPPADVGDYYARIERPGGNGYRRWNRPWLFRILPPFVRSPGQKRARRDPAAGLISHRRYAMFRLIYSTLNFDTSWTSTSMLSLFSPLMVFTRFTATLI